MSDQLTLVTTADWLSLATRRLDTAGLHTARLDASVLLCDCLHLSQAHLLAHPERLLSTTQFQQLETWLERRLRHEPLAYIRGFSEFYGRNFLVTPSVLIPRPESETIIELLASLPRENKALIVDVGTGSGALGITIKLEFNYNIILIDNSRTCLKVARLNAERHRVSVTCLEGDLLQPLRSHARLRSGVSDCILVCNLPYVPDNYPINLAARFEPPLALLGGADGLDHYRRLFAQLQTLPLRPATIVCESMPEQHPQLKLLAQRASYELKQHQGFVQLFHDAA